MAVFPLLNDNITKLNKKSSKFQAAGICVACSIVLHVLVAVMICIRIITINSEVAKTEDSDEAQELVIKIDVKLEEPEPIPTLPVESPPERRAPSTAQELRELASKLPEPEKPKPKPKPKPEPEPEPEPKAQPKDIIQIARTTDDQLQGETPDTNLHGERNTIAASNARPTIGSPDESAVRGKKPEEDRHETVDTTFNEGEFDHMNRGAKPSETSDVKVQVTPPPEIPPLEKSPETASEQEITKSEKKQQEEVKSSIIPTEDTGTELEQLEVAETNKQAREFLDTRKKVALNNLTPTSQNVGAREKHGKEEERNTLANKNVDPDGLKQKAQEKKASEAKSRPKQQPKVVQNKRASDGAKSGFRSQAKATVMEGSISRRSNIASKNVKATPVGKYMSEISKIVETGWQSRMVQHADLVQPGTMVISFMVDERGKVKNINIMSQIAGSESQRSLTFQALLSAKIPPMPKEVVKSQGGDLLRFRYNFSFN